MGRASAASRWSRMTPGSGEVDGRRPTSILGDPHNVGKAPRSGVPQTPWVVIAEGGAGRRIRCDGDLMTSRFEVHVAGRLPQTLSEAISTRFADAAVDKQPNSTV